MADIDPGALAENATGGGPGVTTIADRVGEKISRHAALEIEGVLRHHGSLRLFTGEYPKVSIDMTRAHPDVSVAIAVRWPTPITTVAQEVRAIVSSELVRLTGVTPRHVAISVADAVVDDGAKSRRVQ